MKKFVAFLFAFGFALTVVSCGQKSENNETASDTTVTSEPAPVVEEPVVSDTAAVEPADTTAAE